MSYIKKEWEETHNAEWFDGEDGRWARITPRQDPVSDDPLVVLKELEEEVEIEPLDIIDDDWLIPDEAEDRVSESEDGLCIALGDEQPAEDDSATEETVPTDEPGTIGYYWLKFTELIDRIGDYSGLVKLVIKAEEHKSQSAEMILRSKKELPSDGARIAAKERCRKEIWSALDELNSAATKIGVEPTNNHEQAVIIVRFLIGRVNTPDNPDPSQARRNWMRRQARIGKRHNEARSLKELFETRLELEESGQA